MLLAKGGEVQNHSVFPTSETVHEQFWFYKEIEQILPPFSEKMLNVSANFWSSPQSKAKRLFADEKINQKD